MSRRPSRSPGRRFFGLVVSLVVGHVLGFLDRRALHIVHFGRIDDAELHRAQPRDEILEQLEVGFGVGECLVDVVEGQVILLLGETDEVADDGAGTRGHRAERVLPRLPPDP